jgi:hypothetical protein
MILLSIQLNAQKTEEKFTYNVELGLPAATSNEVFRDIMQGLVSVSTYGQYSFPFHLNVGVGVKYSYFAINEFAVPSPVHGGIHTGGAFVKVGYGKFHNDRFATDFGVKVGYTENFINSDKNKALGVNPVRFNSPIVEPTIGLILTANERNSYRLNLGYAIQGYGFKPMSIGLESNSAFDENKFNNLTQYFFIGFGYTYYFGVKGGD